jgi:hypothetical protein
MSLISGANVGAYKPLNLLAAEDVRGTAPGPRSPLYSHQYLNMSSGACKSKVTLMSFRVNAVLQSR